MTEAELKELAKKAEERFQALDPRQKLRHLYLQRKSFARGMAPTKANYEEYCKIIDEKMPDPDLLSDAEIGLVLLGRYVK